MKLAGELITLVSDNAGDTMQATLVGDTSDVVTLTGVSPASSVRAFQFILSVTLSAAATGNITVTGATTGALFTIRPGETVIPADIVQPRQTTVRDPAKEQYGKPGYEFPKANLDDLSYTERGTVGTDVQPVAWGTPLPTNSRLLLVGQKLTDGEDGKRIHVRVYAKSLKAGEQNTYGYTIDYTAEHSQHPRVTWTIRVLAADYEGLAWSQACLIPGYTGQVLQHEDFTPEDTGVFGAVKLVYEEMPGPDLTGEEGVSQNRMLMRHVSDTRKVTVKQTPVAPNTEAPRAFLITSSVVTPNTAVSSMLETSTVDAFDVLKSTGRDERAEGLLTMTTEEIVPPGTVPLPWVYGRMESSVESIGALRSIRTTRTLFPSGTTGSPVTITGMVAQDPTLGTATIVHAVAHGFTTGMTVTIAGVSGATTAPEINDAWVVTVIDADHFSVPSKLIAAGTGGTAQANTCLFALLVDPAEVDKTTQGVKQTTRQKVAPGSIIEGAFTRTGTGATATATMSGGAIASVAIGGSGGTGYADIVGISVDASDGGITARVYGRAVNGVITSIVILDPGSGYSFTPGLTVLPNAVVDVSRKDIDIAHAWQEITTTASPAAMDIGSAIITQTSRAYKMPDRINASAIQTTGLSDLYNIRRRADNVPVNRFTFYVIGARPTLALDTINFEAVIGLNSACSVASGSPESVGTFREVLHDDVLEVYGYNPCSLGNSLLPVFWPATDPSFSEYEGLVRLSGTIILTNASAGITGTAAGSTATGDIVAGVALSAPAVLSSAWAGPTTTFTDLLIVRPGSGWVGGYKNIFGEVEDVPGVPGMYKCYYDQMLMK